MSSRCANLPGVLPLGNKLNGLQCCDWLGVHRASEEFTDKYLF